MKRKLTIALVAALTGGLPGIVAADASNRNEIEIQRLIGGRVEASETHAVERSFRTNPSPGVQVSRNERIRDKLDLGDPRDDRFQGLDIWND